MRNRTISVAQSDIVKVPLEILIEMIEWLDFEDAINFCAALNLSKALALQYFYFGEDDQHEVFEYSLEEKEAHALLKNRNFLSIAAPNDLVYFALHTRDFNTVKRYLYEPRVDYKVAFEVAAFLQFIDALRLLIYDFNVDPSTNNNQVLLDAAEFGEMETFKYLLSDPRVDPSDQDNQALVWLAAGGYIDECRLLLSDSRVNPSAQSNDAFFGAADNGHEDVCRLLASHPAFEPPSSSELIEAIENENLFLSKLLLYWVYSPDDYNRAFFTAAKIGHAECIKFLLSEDRMDPSTFDQEAFVVAVEKGHEEIVKLFLLDPRVNPAYDDNLAFIAAAQNGNINILSMLLSDPRINISADHYDIALTKAAKNGFLEVLDLVQNHPLPESCIKKIRSGYYHRYSELFF